MKPGPLQTRWIEELRAHPELQGTGRLGERDSHGTTKMCCLGLGGLIAGVCEWDGSILFTSRDREIHTLVENYGALRLRSEVGNFDKTKADFSTISVFCEYEFDVYPDDLTELNDDFLTWPQIADFIELNAEHIFTEPV